MITPELLTYVTTEKRNGRDNETIRRALTLSNWQETDIVEALAQASSLAKEMPIKKPLVAKLISALLFVKSLEYLTSLGGMVLVIFQMNQSMVESNQLTTSILTLLPQIGLLMVGATLMATLFFFLGLKVLDGSKKSLTIAIIATAIVPILFSLLVYLLVIPVFQTNSGFINTTDISPSAFTQFSYRFFLDIFVYLVVMVLLLKKFTFPSIPLSGRQKLAVILFFLFTFLPTLIYVSVEIFVPKKQDTGVAKIQSQISFHYYQPVFESKSIVQTTIPHFIDMFGLKYAIRTNYGFPTGRELGGQKDRPVAIEQVSVSDNFDLSVFVNSITKTPYTFEPLQIGGVATGPGYFVSRPVNTPGFYVPSLYLLTTDRVLIHIAALNHTKEELIQIAKSLK